MSPRWRAGTPPLPTPIDAARSSPRSRAVVGTGGQSVHAGDRLYLAEGVPLLIVWGRNYPMIPARHGQPAHEAITGSRVKVFDGVGHIPQLEAPARFVAGLERFLAETEPARWDAAVWRARLRGAGRRCVGVAAARLPAPRRRGPRGSVEDRGVTARDTRRAVTGRRSSRHEHTRLA